MLDGLPYNVPNPVRNMSSPEPSQAKPNQSDSIAEQFLSIRYNEYFAAEV